MLKAEYLDTIKKADSTALLIEFNKQSQNQGAFPIFSEAWKEATDWVKAIREELMERLK